MRYSLLAGGKRIRPVLALATARAVGMDQEDVLPLACAIELIHTYSLIHDDLPAMDDDELRRGQPTCHVASARTWRSSPATRSTRRRSGTCSRVSARSPSACSRAAAELAYATGVNGMVGGQYLDISREAPPEQPGAAALRHVHELKTGRLITASVSCVLLLAGAPEPATIVLPPLRGRARVLFQIVDDILDVTGTDAALGKPSGSDVRHGRHTYVSEFGVERARELATESHRAARAALAEAVSPPAPAPPRPRPGARADHRLHLHRSS